MKKNLGTCMFAALLLCLPGCGKKESAAYKYACRYVNPYSNLNECVEYHGDWTEAQASEDCVSTFSTLTPKDIAVGTEACDVGEDCVAGCIIEKEGSQKTVTRYYGENFNFGMSEGFCEGEIFGGTFEVGCTEISDEIPDAGESTVEQAALDAMVSNDQVTVTPECVDDACLETLVTAGDWIEFMPNNAEPTVGFIIYPGAAVDPRAYAPAAQAIAVQGNILVIIVPMRNNNPINGVDSAGSVAAGYPDIQNWFLSGHSLGGISAIQYVGENPDAMTGLVLWAAYGTTDFDISDSETPTTVISGSEDGLSTAEKVESGKDYLPADAVYIALPGANHAQFGYYGEQDGDGAPKISKENQQELVVAATLHSINRVLAGGATAHAAFADAEGELGNWCLQAQRAITGISEAELPASSVDQVTPDNLDDYVSCHAEIDSGVGKSSICTLLHYGGNATSLLAPPVYEDEIWCKMKDQPSLVAELDLTAAGNQGTCADLNQAALDWALDQVTAEEKAAYAASGKSLVFGDDIAADAGPAWVTDTDATLTETATSGTYELKAATLVVGNDESVPANSRNVVYCKLWTPARALTWVLTQK